MREPFVIVGPKGTGRTFEAQNMALKSTQPGSNCDATLFVDCADLGDQLLPSALKAQKSLIRNKDFETNHETINVDEILEEVRRPERSYKIRVFIDDFDVESCKCRQLLQMLQGTLPCKYQLIIFTDFSQLKHFKCNINLLEMRGFSRENQEEFIARYSSVVGEDPLNFQEWLKIQKSIVSWRLDTVTPLFLRTCLEFWHRFSIHDILEKYLERLVANRAADSNERTRKIKRKKKSKRKCFCFGSRFKLPKESPYNRAPDLLQEAGELALETMGTCSLPVKIVTEKGKTVEQLLKAGILTGDIHDATEDVPECSGQCLSKICFRSSLLKNYLALRVLFLKRPSYNCSENTEILARKLSKIFRSKLLPRPTILSLCLGFLTKAMIENTSSCDTFCLDPVEKVCLAALGDEVVEEINDELQASTSNTTTSFVTKLSIWPTIEEYLCFLECSTRQNYSDQILAKCRDQIAQNIHKAEYGTMLPFLKGKTSSFVFESKRYDIETTSMTLAMLQQSEPYKPESNILSIYINDVCDESSSSSSSPSANLQEVVDKVKGEKKAKLFYYRGNGHSFRQSFFEIMPSSQAQNVVLELTPPFSTDPIPFIPFKKRRKSTSKLEIVDLVIKCRSCEEIPPYLLDALAEFDIRKLTISYATYSVCMNILNVVSGKNFFQLDIRHCSGFKEIACAASLATVLRNASKLQMLSFTASDVPLDFVLHLTGHCRKRDEGITIDKIPSEASDIIKIQELLNQGDSILRGLIHGTISEKRILLLASFIIGHHETPEKIKEIEKIAADQKIPVTGCEEDKLRLNMA